jgi:hypothetical protein
VSRDTRHDNQSRQPDLVEPPPKEAAPSRVLDVSGDELVIVTSTASHWLEEGVLEGAHALVPSVELIAVTPVVSPGK